MDPVTGTYHHTEFPLVPEKGFKISSLAKGLLAALALTAAAAVIVSAVLLVQTGFPITFIALVVSSVALGILLTTLLYPTIKPYLPASALSVLDRVTGVAKEFFTVPLVLGAMAIQGIFGKGEESFAQEGDPILLIHGYAGTSAHLVYLKYHLKENQAGAIFTIDLGNPFLSNNDYAKKVAERVKEILTHYPGKKITLVTHSMGALSGLRFTSDFSDQVAQVITLGAAFGTYLAYIALGECGKEMRPNSPYLQRIEEDLATKNIPVTSVGSRSDVIIIPNKSAFLKKLKTTNITFPSMGHATYLWSDQMAACLIELVKKPSNLR